MKRFTPVRVTWVDCTQRQQWEDWSDIKKPINLLCETIAFFIEWRKDCLVLCRSLAHIEDGMPETVDSTMYIPRVAVKKVRVLR